MGCKKNSNNKIIDRKTVAKKAKQLVKQQTITEGLNQAYSLNNVINHAIKHTITGAALGGLMAAAAPSFEDESSSISRSDRIIAGAALGSSIGGIVGTVMGPGLSYGLKKLDEKFFNSSNKKTNKKD